eukprot:CAMPEP_0195513072 /NCGR_PEP_ID=MMETSP0794_2-20130614/4813_1 /TAXON_ID=515487 /ORGANISM="Stephanopyxis turris, Strain CCMP 815" /LENGTH=716 /DNA_ID=CAMNT_0040640997 /DNA_START=330 /DNA_END=2480 /DNA_ORIENTATION=-
MNNVHLKILERNANANPSNPDIQFQFLRELSNRFPDAVIARFEQFPNHAVDERCALEYLGAMGRMDTSNGGKRMMSNFDLDKLVHRLASSGGASPLTVQALANLSENSGSVSKTNPDGSSTITKKSMTKAQQAMAAMEILSGGGVGALGAATAGGAMPRFSNFLGGGQGLDPKKPLHVVIDAQKEGWRGQLFRLARSGLYVFFVMSLLGAILDEKGNLSRALTGGGKVVQEAEGSDVRFDDVKGVDEAKEDLQEIVEYLKNPQKFTRLGGKLPKGLLLTGPPGTGKTLLAKAIAGEADVPFFFASGSQFEEMYVGVGAKRVRDLFEAAKEKAPCIIFLDEIDAVGGSRRLKDQSALKMTLNELLVQMDGFEENNGIIIIGATNFKESLDTALLRPGRFDKHVTVSLPDVAGRKEILEMYGKKTKLDESVDLNVLARGTPGFSGADLFNVMNQAALKASIDGLNAITMPVLEFAKDKILMGAERKSAVITAETAKCTAFHEAGHALVATLTDGANPVHKATIMPRGSSLGMVSMLPEGDQTSMSLKEMLASLDVSMGGRVAEQLVFGDENVTSGAVSDIANATKIARAMVTKYGFSPEVGIVFHGGDTGEASASPETRAKIDSEVKRLTEQSYARTTEMLKKHRKTHTLLAETLLEYETLTGEEVRDIVLKGIKPKRPVLNISGGAKGDTAIFNKGKSIVGGVGGKVGASREEARSN